MESVRRRPEIERHLQGVAPRLRHTGRFARFALRPCCVEALHRQIRGTSPAQEPGQGGRNNERTDEESRKRDSAVEVLGRTSSDHRRLAGAVRCRRDGNESAPSEGLD